MCRPGRRRSGRRQCSPGGRIDCRLLLFTRGEGTRNEPVDLNVPWPTPPGGVGETVDLAA